MRKWIWTLLFISLGYGYGSVARHQRRFIVPAVSRKSPVLKKASTLFPQVHRNLASGTSLGQAQGTGIPVKRFYQYDQTILEAAKHYKLDPLFIKAILVIESGLNPAAVSKANARGIAQFMRATAKTLGIVDRHDPDASIWGCAALVRRLYDRFDGNVALVAAAYNAGPQAIARAGLELTKMRRETQRYVPSVIWTWKRMCLHHQNEEDD